MHTLQDLKVMAHHKPKDIINIKKKQKAKWVTCLSLLGSTVSCSKMLLGSDFRL